MKRLFTLAILFAALAIASQKSYSQYNSPESVCYDSVGKRYLVSNTSSSKIMQRDLNGNVADFVTVGGGIHGLRCYGGRVYICNGTSVKGYDLTSAAQVFNITVSGSSFLNGMTIDDNGIIYVSDFSGRRIYKINPAINQFWIFVPSTTNQPNGVYYDAPRNRLLVCCWGASAPVKQVNLADSSISNIITTPYSNCDGIFLDRNDNVYISTWGIQSVVKYDINFTTPVVAVPGLSNPADIFINKTADTLAVPNAGNSTVTFHYLNNPTSVGTENQHIADKYVLSQNYPNPFNPVTTINFSLPENTSHVTIEIHDITGKLIKQAFKGKLSAGEHSIQFDGSELNSGVYYYSLKVNGFGREVKKMIIVK